MITQINDYNFDPEVLKCDITVLTEFWAEWCSPCRALDAALTDLAEDNPEYLKIVKLDIESNPEVTAAYRVLNVPTFIIFRNGQEVDRIEGNTNKNALAAHLKPHLPQ